MKSLIFILLFLLSINGQSLLRCSDRDENFEVRVIVGDSVSLHTNISQIQPNSVISWMFEEEDIARIHVTYSIRVLFFNNTHRLELDKETGNLKIGNVKITDSGNYIMQNNGPCGRTTKIFKVSVINTTSGVNVVPVLERDSVILPSGLDKLQSDEQLTWNFKDTPIAHVNQTSSTILDGRFKDKLQVNQKNGSLIITNVKLNNSGLYEVQVSKAGGRFGTNKTINLIVDPGNRLSVMEGASVILESGVSEINKDEVLMWRCEHGDSILVKITNGTFAIFNGADGRFKDKLEVNHTTGSLTIMKIRMEHAGLYHLDIIGTQRTRFKRINIFVYSQGWPPHILAEIGVAFLLAMSSLVFAVICLYRICHEKQKSSAVNITKQSR